MVLRTQGIAEPALGRATAGPEPAPGRWDIDVERSRVQVTIRHALLSKVSATLSVAHGTIEVGTDPPRGQVRATIDMRSVDSGDPRRDGHLRSEGYLDVEHFPVASFESSEVTAVERRRWRLSGALTVRDVTRPVVLTARLEDLGAVGGRQRATVVASAELERRKFGISWNQALEAGGLLLGPTLSVQLVIEAWRAESQAASPSPWQ